MISRDMITLLITINIIVPTQPCTIPMRTMLTMLTVIPALLAKRETSGSSAYEASAGASSVCVHMIVDAWRDRAASRGAVLATWRRLKYEIHYTARWGPPARWGPLPRRPLTRGWPRARRRRPACGARAPTWRDPKVLEGPQGFGGTPRFWRNPKVFQWEFIFVRHFLETMGFLIDMPFLGGGVSENCGPRYKTHSL